MIGRPVTVEPRLMNRRGAARYLAVCPRTVRNLVRRGKLAEVPIGFRRLYDIEDLDAYVDRQKKVNRSHVAS